MSRRICKSSLTLLVVITIYLHCNVLRLEFEQRPGPSGCTSSEDAQDGCYLFLACILHV